MTDVVAGVAGKAAMSMFGPHPSITIVTFWQGIVEIALRGVSVVSQCWWFDCDGASALGDVRGNLLPPLC